MTGSVVSVSARKGHGVGKTPLLSIDLIAGQGVAGDAHCGERIKHRSRARFNPGLANSRQVHLIHAELFDDPKVRSFALVPGELGENILTRGIDLLKLGEGCVLAIGATARLRITGLRNPCIQLERHKAGLMAALLDHDDEGDLVRKGGVMAVVEVGGEVVPGDSIIVEAPDGPYRPLKPV